jgi:glc operon protein GlcG
MHSLRLAGIALCAVVFSLFALPQNLVAQTPQSAAALAPPALTYDMARQVMDAAEAEARKNKWNVVIVVTDAAGVPVMLRRLDGAGARPYDIAMRKAATVVAAKMATSEYGAQLKAGTVKEVPNGITFAGGVPIMRGGELIGAVGTSGVRANEDEQISKSGAAVIK